MDQATHNRIVSFIRGIADDVLRGLVKCGRHLNAVELMCLLRRLG